MRGKLIVLFLTGFSIFYSGKSIAQQASETKVSIYAKDVYNSTRSDKTSDDALRFKFWYNDNFVKCYSIKVKDPGWHFNTYFLVTSHIEALSSASGYLPTSKKIEMEAWEEDKGDGCEYNSDDDQYCGIIEKTLDFSNYEPGVYYQKEIAYCQNAYKINYSIHYSPPVPQTPSIQFKNGPSFSNYDPGSMGYKCPETEFRLSTQTYINSRFHYKTDIVWEYHINGEKEIIFEENPNFCGYEPICQQGGPEAPYCCNEFPYIVKEFPKWREIKTTKGNQNTISFFPKGLTGISGITENTQVIFRVKTIINGKEIFSSLSDELFISPAAPTFTVNTITQSCRDNATGTLDISVNGVTHDYRYFLISPDYPSLPPKAFTQSNLKIENIPAGTYTLKVSNNNSNPQDNHGVCSTEKPVTINNYDHVQFAISSTPACSDINNGEIAVAVSGGKPGNTFDFTISPKKGDFIADPKSENKGVFINLPAATYQITASDQCNTTTSSPVTVKKRKEITASIVPGSSTCDDPYNASLKVTGNDGPGKYSYYLYEDGKNVKTKLNTTATTWNITSGLTSGKKYYIEIKDADYPTCKTYTSENYTFTKADLKLNLVAKSNIKCPDDTQSGEIYLSATGGSGKYSFTVENGAFKRTNTIGTFTGLPEGTYKVTVINDKSTCADSYSIPNITISRPAAIHIAMAQKNIQCLGDGDGSLTATVSGGNGGYTYRWEKRNSTAQPWQNYTGKGSTTTKITGLSPAQYRLKVTDKNGCAKTSGVYTLSEPSKMLDIEEVIFTHIRCKSANDGSIRITATGGWGNYTYLYSKDNGKTYISFTNATPFPPGKYQLRVQDKEGCTADYWEEIELTKPSTPLSFTHTLSQRGDYSVTCNDGNDGTITVEASGGNDVPFDENYWYAIDGSDFTDIPVFDNLTPGNHTVQVKDERGCIIEKKINLSAPEPIALTHVEKNYIQCFGDTSSYLTIEVQGGISPYQYRVNAGTWQDTTHFANLTAGPHEITVLDAYGCTSTFTETIATNPLLTLNFLTKDVRCFGENNGQIKAMVDGGKKPYTYIWQNREETGDTLHSLSPGIYTLSIIDAEGCNIQKSIPIHQPEAPLAAVAIPTDVRCFGEDNGSIAVQASGGTLPYSFSLDSGVSFQEDSVFQPLMPGHYQVLVQDTRGCRDTASTVIHEPAVLTLEVAEKKDVLCYRDSTGYIRVEGTGGNLPYTFSMDRINYQYSNEFHHLMAGDYSIFIRDARGCEDSVAVTLIQPDEPLALTDSVTQVQCKGSATGAIHTHVTGGTPGYTYFWAAESTTSQHLENVIAGAYALVVTDAHGCELKDTIEISEPEVALQITLTNQINVSCNGLSDGSFSIEATGGYPPYQYSFENGEYNDKIAFDSLASGEYSVAVKDTMGCIFTLQVTIEEPAPLAASFSEINHVSCYGYSDASCEVTVTGGTGPYSYSLDSGINFQSSPVFSELPVGDYQVWVKDAHHCQATVDLTIIQPALLTASVTEVMDAACGQANGGAGLVVNGGTFPYTYAWKNKEKEEVASEQHPLNLFAGIYEVIVEDAQGCQVHLTQIINDEDGPSSQITAKTDATCFDVADGSASVIATGGAGNYQYHWSDSFAQTSPTAENLYRGQYFVTVTDARGCISISEAVIGSPEKIDYQLINFIEPACYENCDGLIEVEARGGIAPYSYAWDSSVKGMDSKAEHLCRGTYALTITDAIGCTYTPEFVLQAPDSLRLEVAHVQPPTCYQGEDGNIQIRAQGGTPTYQYAWDDPLGQSTAEASQLRAGTYQVLITDQQGCHAQASVQIEETPPLPIHLPPTVTLCKDQSVVLNAGIADADYEWSKDGTFFSDQRMIEAVAGGTYQLWVQDARGCMAVKETIISAYDTLFEANFLHISDLIIGDTLLLTEVCFPKPDSVHWLFSPAATVLDASPAAPQLTFTEAGTYPVQMTAYYSVCTDAITKTVTFVLPEEGKEDNARFTPLSSGIESVEVYPNPTTGSFTVKVTLFQSQHLFGFLYHLNGQEITRVQGKGQAQYAFTFDIGGYPAGAYSLHLVTESERKIVRILLH